MADKVIQQIKGRLAGYSKRKLEMELQAERLARMRSRAVLPGKPSGGGPGGKGGVGDPMAAATTDFVEYEKRVIPQLREAKAEMEAIEAEIAALSDPLERAVLRARYIECKDNRLTRWPEVAAQLYGDSEERHLRAVFRVHGRALLHLKSLFWSTCSGREAE